MAAEQISPELALVDPELAVRARVTLADPATSTRAPLATSAQATASEMSDRRPYPFWARVTAAMWLLVLGILVGGTAIPHAQDRPRVVPQEEDARFCRAPGETPAEPQGPGR
jgi:hypothetical protein